MAFRPCGLCRNYSILSLEHKGSQRQYRNEQAGLFPQKMLFINSQWADFPMGHNLQTPGLGERVMMRRYGGPKQRKLAQEGGIIIPIHGLKPGHKVSDRTRGTNTIPGGARLVLLFHYNLSKRHGRTRCKREATQVTGNEVWQEGRKQTRGWAGLSTGAQESVYHALSFMPSHTGPHRMTEKQKPK